MKTPVGVTLEEFRQERREWLERYTVAWPGTGGLQCVSCGEAIRGQAVVLDIHDRRLPGCQGDGEMIETGVPYCPNCEELPRKRGCVHV
jgi:hypothetical protein